MPWLLARVTASTPADRRASKAVSGARKVYCLGAGVPRRVTAVSRFTIPRSAAARTWPADPQLCVRARAEAPSKWTSPAKASVAVARGLSRDVPGSAPRGEGLGAGPEGFGDGTDGPSADGEASAEGVARTPSRTAGPWAAHAATDHAMRNAVSERQATWGWRPGGRPTVCCATSRA